ncbi:hypothetical protein [Terriglobus sp.]|uniref:hypothetical protein n=1 Tax=Terriglobus sp. TaxID=1889013 RepID=UPI003B00FD63
MIVWSGLGFLGALIPFVTAILAVFAANAALGRGYGAMHMWPMALGVLIGAGLVYLLSVRLDKPGRLLIDPATGQRVVMKSRHTLFWIPLQWIALIAAVVGLLLFLVPANTMGKGGKYDTSTPSENTRLMQPQHVPSA